LITCRGFDADPDDLHNWNVSQALEPFKKQSWKMLTSPIPQAVQEGSRHFLDSYFYNRNSQAKEIAVEEAEKLMDEPYQDPWDSNFDDNFVKMVKDSLNAEKESSRA